MNTERNIKDQFNQIKESFTYLGVLKDMPLTDAMQAVENVSHKIIKLSERTWKKQKFPDRKGLFTELGEDYDKIETLLYSNEALSPIYSGFKQIYRYLEQMRDAGVSLAEAKERLKAIIESKK